jgi:hypothetical protein
MNMKGTADDERELAFFGSDAACGVGSPAFSMAGDSVGSAGGGYDGASSVRIGPLSGGG